MRLKIDMEIDVEIDSNNAKPDEETVLNEILKDITEYVTKDNDEENTVTIKGKIESMEIEEWLVRLNQTLMPL